MHVGTEGVPVLALAERILDSLPPAHPQPIRVSPDLQPHAREPAAGSRSWRDPHQRTIDAHVPAQRPRIDRPLHRLVVQPLQDTRLVEPAPLVLAGGRGVPCLLGDLQPQGLPQRMLHSRTITRHLCSRNPSSERRRRQTQDLCHRSNGLLLVQDQVHRDRLELGR
jgi:hypothetical protein